MDIIEILQTPNANNDYWSTIVEPEVSNIDDIKFNTNQNFDELLFKYGTRWKSAIRNIIIVAKFALDKSKCVKDGKIESLPIACTSKTLHSYIKPYNRGKKVAESCANTISRALKELVQLGLLVVAKNGKYIYAHNKINAKCGVCREYYVNKDGIRKLLYWSKCQKLGLSRADIHSISDSLDVIESDYNSVVESATNVDVQNELERISDKFRIGSNILVSNITFSEPKVFGNYLKQLCINAQPYIKDIYNTATELGPNYNVGINLKDWGSSGLVCGAGLRLYNSWCYLPKEIRTNKLKDELGDYVHYDRTASIHQLTHYLATKKVLNKDWYDAVIDNKKFPKILRDTLTTRALKKQFINILAMSRSDRHAAAVWARYSLNSTIYKIETLLGLVHRTKKSREYRNYLYELLCKLVVSKPQYKQLLESYDFWNNKYQHITKESYIKLFRQAYRVYCKVVGTPRRSSIFVVESYLMVNLMKSLKTIGVQAVDVYDSIYISKSSISSNLDIVEYIDNQTITILNNLDTMYSRELYSETQYWANLRRIWFSTKSDTEYLEPIDLDITKTDDVFKYDFDDWYHAEMCQRLTRYMKNRWSA